MFLIQKGNSIRSVSKSSRISYSVLQRYKKKKKKMNNHVEVNTIGGQTTLPLEMEQTLVVNIIKCADLGYPVSELELRMFVKYHLDQIGHTIKRFKNNCPGIDWVKSFLKRHIENISQRMCRNIKRNRAEVNKNIINTYFDNLSQTLEGVSPSNIINYDETNLSDDPGRKKVICKRGTKYPKRVMNQSKSATSVMFAATTDGQLLPPYVIYKSAHLYDTWTEGGPPGTRYNRSSSGWIDGQLFLEWYSKIIIPHCRRLNGKKVIIGDNLSSYLSSEVIKLSKKHSIDFIFLPPNSTHLTQPLDVVFFRPLKGAWRLVLENWKTCSTKGKLAASINKDSFPSLLKNTLCHFVNKNGENIIAGFEKTGIYPLNRNKVLDMLPPDTENDGSMINDNSLVSENLATFLKESRYRTPDPTKKTKEEKIKGSTRKKYKRQ